MMRSEGLEEERKRPTLSPSPMTLMSFKFLTCALSSSHLPLSLLLVVGIGIFDVETAATAFAEARIDVVEKAQTMAMINADSM